MCHKLIVSEIAAHPIQVTNSPTFCEYFYKNCNHCLKPVFCCPENLTNYPTYPFYCDFCTRNQIETTSKLYFTFRSIFGYLYIENYIFNVNKSRISLAHLSKAIENHIAIGKKYCIRYDPQSYFWCIQSFNSNKLMVMVEDILNLFELHKWLQNYSHCKLLQSFKSCFSEYQEKQNNIVFIPTLENLCDNKTDFSASKNFLANYFKYR
jgi:hypothetical protein